MFIFELHGKPIPNKSVRATCPCHKVRMYDPSAKDKDMLSWQIKPFAPAEPLKGAIELTLTFFLPIPKGTSAVKRRQMINRVILPTIKPDEDNLAYIVTNVMKKMVYDDDRQIVAKHVYKFYGEEPKTVIKVREIAQMEFVGVSNELDL